MSFGELVYKKKNNKKLLPCMLLLGKMELKSENVCLQNELFQIVQYTQITEQ